MLLELRSVSFFNIGQCAVFWEFNIDGLGSDTDREIFRGNILQARKVLRSTLQCQFVIFQST